METQVETIQAFLETVHPYDSLPRDELARVAGCFGRREYAAGEQIYALGEPLKGLYLIKRGAVEVTDANGALVSILAPRNSFGERGLLRDGLAVTSSHAVEATVVLMLPEGELRHLMANVPAFARFFNRARPAEGRDADLATLKVGDLMTRGPVSLPPGATVAEVACVMRDKHVSSVAITQDDTLIGLVTTRDLTERVMAEGLGFDTPVRQVMTPDPVSLGPDALGSDILHAMLERRIGHVPVVQDGKLKGMITQTDLTRFQAVSSAQLVRDVASAETPQEMAEVTARIPRLLQQLVASHNAHEVVTRLITDIADTVTRRLLKLAEAQLGPAPVPYLWLACGSQGRQEQTGVSDQDNCLILDDAATADDRVYFKALAKFVSDGLNAAGYVYCPGDMM
ncbi:MAG: CBS domain-containing protein, partial [Rhodobacteraceae bacterium]|nr:CBS domain-containing protein [Paracoccaceae bacterium]